jgi:hypothetical protein
VENDGILLFCITNELNNDIFLIHGMDGLGKLYSIENSGLFAIVGNVDLAQYGEEAMAEKGEDIEWLKAKAVMFMDIILKINSLSSMIPMKFLTIFTAEERVKNIITENYELFVHNFEKINKREELSVKMYCDEKKYKEKVMGDEIVNFEKSLVGKPKGAAFFLKKKFDGELEDKIQSRICDLANEFAENLKSFAAEMRSNKILAKEITEISTPMILNCAFLVDIDKQEQFATKIDELKGYYESNGFMIELSGPWPPFSFCE